MVVAAVAAAAAATAPATTRSDRGEAGGGAVRGRVRPGPYGGPVQPQPSLRALVCDLAGEDCWPDVDDAESATGGGGPAGGPRPDVAEAARMCPRGQVMAARQDGRDVVVGQLEDGRVFVLPDRCPHDGGRLSDGFVERGRLVCARHGWELDPQTGERLWPPPRPPGAAPR